MTKADKPVTREVLTKGECRRPLVLTLDNINLTFREKGMRRSYVCPIEAAYWLAIKAAAIEARKSSPTPGRSARQ